MIVCRSPDRFNFAVRLAIAEIPERTLFGSDAPDGDPVIARTTSNAPPARHRSANSSSAEQRSGCSISRNGHWGATVTAARQRRPDPAAT